MTGTVGVVWRIDPLTPPRPRRHCGTCGQGRAFHSSGKVRLNANGRRLDAWLIYMCGTCDRTWNLPLLEREAVASISCGDLLAMQVSDPAWVREREFDLVLLRRHCGRIDLSSDLAVTKVVVGAVPEAWSVVEFAIVAAPATGQRLDRLLAGELGLGRPEILSMLRAGGLQLEHPSAKALRRPVSGNFTLRFIAACLSERQYARLSRALLCGPEDRAP